MVLMASPARAEHFMFDSSLQILEGAKETLKMYGWLQGESGDEVRGFCLSGALYHVATKLPETEARESFDKVVVLLDAMVAHSHPTFFTFNDDPLTTKDRVLCLLDNAISITANRLSTERR